MNTQKESTGSCCSVFREGMRVQRLSQHRIKGEVDYVREDGKVVVTWDVCGRWSISPDDLRIIVERPRSPMLAGSERDQQQRL
jgi:hypothetical protein